MGRSPRRLLRAPGLALAPFVTALWYCEGPCADGLERIVPSPSMQLVVDLNADQFRLYRGARFDRIQRTRGAVVAGLFTSPHAIDTRQQRRAAGVIFAPGGAAPFLAAPAHEVSERYLDLESLWGPAGRTLRERLLEAPDPPSVLRRLELELRRRAGDLPARDRLVDHAIAALARGARVRQVTQQMGLTPRSFIERFASVAGLTPKRFARVQRLRRALHHAHTHPGAGGAELAAACGYTDQAHMIHEFRALAGLSPRALQPRPASGLSHVPIAALAP